MVDIIHRVGIKSPIAKVYAALATVEGKWATFLMSLIALVETRKGKPAPNNIKIDNWN